MLFGTAWFTLQMMLHALLHRHAATRAKQMNDRDSAVKKNW
jgi:hypothetical protein